MPFLFSKAGNRSAPWEIRHLDAERTRTDASSVFLCEADIPPFSTGKRKRSHPSVPRTPRMRPAPGGEGHPPGARGRSASPARRERLRTKGHLFAPSCSCISCFSTCPLSAPFHPQRARRENHLTGHRQRRLWSARMTRGEEDFLFRWEGETLIILTLPASSRCFNFASSSPLRALFQLKRLVILFYISSL